MLTATHVLDWFIVALTVLGALTQLAVLRAPDLPEPDTVEAIRRIKIAGLSILSLHFGYLMLVSGSLFLMLPVQLGLTLYLGGEFYRGLYRLFQHVFDQHAYHSCKKPTSKEHTV